MPLPGRTPIGLCTVDLGFRLTWVNESFSRLLARPVDSLVGASFLDVTHPDDVMLDRELSERVFAGAIPYFTVRKRYLRGDGTQLVGDLLATVVRDDEGTITGGFATMVDAADAEPVATRLARLQMASMVGDVAVGAAHELGNALAALDHALRTESADGERNDAATEILDHARGLLGQITPQPLPPQPGAESPLSALVDSFRGMLELVLPPTIRLEIDLDDTPVTIPVEPLRQILLNLVLNARDAISAVGAGTISITQPQNEGGSLAALVHISNDGPGLDIDPVDAIFDPTFTTKGADGTGLGLYISRDLATRHGGALRVIPRTSGVTFELALRSVDR